MTTKKTVETANELASELTKFRSAYSSPKKSVLDTGSDTQVQQSFKEECDINAIVRKYTVSGVIDHVQASQAAYMDVTDVTDYHTMCNLVLGAQEKFNSLPAKIRKRFSYDPSKLIAFLNDASNLDEAVELGLVTITKPKKVSDDPNPSEKSAEAVKASD